MTTTGMKKVFEFYYNKLINLDPKFAGGLVFIREMGTCDYQDNDIPRFELCCHLAWMCRRAAEVFVPNAAAGAFDDLRKAATWLGYVQGELRAMKLFSVNELREHNRNPDGLPEPTGIVAHPAPPTYGTVPRRFVLPVDKHPNGSPTTKFYGCYFPQTDLVIGEMGSRGTGMPTEKTNPGLVWLDQPRD